VIPDRRVLFIVGSGRSGTTLVYEILCCDPAAAWISNYSQRLTRLARLHPRAPSGFKGSTTRFAVRPVEGYRLYDRVRARAGGAYDGVLTGQDCSDREVGALRRAIARHLSRRSADYFVSKNTRNTRRVGYLAAALPEATFVHVVRHPVAVVGSMLAVPFFDDVRIWWLGGARVAELVARGHDRSLLAAEVWLRETAACDAALSTVPESRRAVVHYEDFVDDPIDEVSSVLELVDREPSPSLVRQIKARAISNRNGPTMSRLTVEQQASIWSVVGDRAARYGYSLGDPGRLAQ